MNKKSVQQIAQDKEQKIMETVAWRAGYYRANPQRFIADVTNIKLKWFQQILLWAMMHFNYFCFIASRGLGKYKHFHFKMASLLFSKGEKVNE